MAAAAAEVLDFEEMSEAELRQWVEANPGRVNDRDSRAFTPLTASALYLRSLAMVMRLLDEKRADANATMENGRSALHYVKNTRHSYCLAGPWCGPYSGR